MALGTTFSAEYCSDDSLWEDLDAAGKREHDLLWVSSSEEDIRENTSLTSSPFSFDLFRECPSTIPTLRLCEEPTPISATQVLALFPRSVVHSRRSDFSFSFPSQIGERYGGANIAAAFLKEFVHGLTGEEKDKTDIKWAHLDIAGTMDVSLELFSQLSFVDFETDPPRPFLHSDFIGRTLPVEGNDRTICSNCS